jgi:hypothetical protein
MPDVLLDADMATTYRAVGHLCRETGRSGLTAKEIATYLQWPEGRTRKALKAAADRHHVGFIQRRRHFYWRPTKAGDADA